ncbi:MAG: amino-acid N-acetyltransferase [Gammaproteobacteria bacterium]|nr:MAG: amino-acid N-acetyltransferase [Gammaproteobacteria bacterium]
MNKEIFDNSSHILREALTYIGADIGKVIVIHLPYYIFKDENFNIICQDIVTLFSIGVKIVLVFNVDKNSADLPIDEKQIKKLLKNSGILKHQLQQSLTKNKQNKRIISGNFLLAKSVGIIDGVDLINRAKIRGVASDDIKEQLQNNNILIVDNLAITSSGSIKAISSLSVASKIAQGIVADKLIFLTDLKRNTAYNLPINLTTNEAKNFKTDDKDLTKIIKHSIDFTHHNLSRAHILNYHYKNSLLRELFTRDGCGFLISSDKYDYIREATTVDINDIHKLLKNEGAGQKLLKKDKKDILQKISTFWVMEIDGFVTSCLSCEFDDKNNYVFVSSMVTHSAYQNQGRACKLLKYVEKKATDKNIKKIFTQSTRSIDWFQQRAYMIVPISNLPTDKQQMYDTQRNSKILMKML